MSDYSLEMADFIGYFMEQIDILIMSTLPWAFLLVSLVSVIAIFTVFVLWVKYYARNGG